MDITLWIEIVLLVILLLLGEITPKTLAIRNNIVLVGHRGSGG